MGLRVLLVDDHPLVRGALRLAIAQAWPGADCVEAESLAAAEALLSGGPQPDLVVLDLRLPDADGLSNLVVVRRLAPEARVAIFSGLATEEISNAAARLGADAVIPKTAAAHEVVAALEAVTARGRSKAPLAPPRVEAASRRVLPGLDELSTAQLRVFLALAEGRTNSEIADTLGIAEATVKAHLTAIYRRLGVENRIQAALAARRLGAP